MSETCKELISRIVAFKKKTGLSYISIAESSGLGRNTLLAAESPTFNPRADTIDAVLEFIKKCSKKR